jgi:hypothetical protein
MRPAPACAVLIFLASASVFSQSTSSAVPLSPADVTAILTAGAADAAVAPARTGAFFSHDQAPLSSRTVRFIAAMDPDTP